MSYTDITSTRYDADSPLDEDLMGDIVLDIKHDHDRGLRVGTNATGVRRALAQGVKSESLTTDGSGDANDTVTITFSSDAIDGDPNFDSSIVCLGLTFRELSTGSDLGTPDSVSVWLDEAGFSATGASVKIAVRGGGISVTIDYALHWAFTGLVVSGE